MGDHKRGGVGWGGAGCTIITLNINPMFPFLGCELVQLEVSGDRSVTLLKTDQCENEKVN